MDSFDQTMQALRSYSLPNCIQQNHVDNLILIRNDKDNNCLQAQCGECDKNNNYENEKISTKFLLRLIIEQLYSKNVQFLDDKQSIESNLKLIDNLVQLLKNNSVHIHQEIQHLNQLKEDILKYSNKSNIVSEIKEIVQNILTTNYGSIEFQNKINQLSKLIQVNSNKGQQKISFNFKPYNFDKNSYLFIQDQLKEIEFKLSKLEIQFDTNYSSRFYNFERGNNTAIFSKNSENYPNDYSKIKNQEYYDWPVLRINKLIESGIFKIKFKMNYKGYFGLGTPQLPSNGFPGYTKFGYVHYTNGTDAWYNDEQFKKAEQLFTNSENVVNKEVEFIVDADSHECTTSYDGKLIKRKYPLPNPVYIIFSLYYGSIELIK